MVFFFQRTSASLRIFPLPFLSPARFLSAAPAVVSPPEIPNAVPTQPLTKPQLTTLVLSQYQHGKFSNLVQNIISSPSVLLTACHNLIHGGPNSPAPPTTDSISTNFFSITDMSEEIRQNRFDFNSCTLKIANEGESVSLVLPNLKLKVLIESIRMVLEVIYDDRFATFSYGGRVGMGRHTAIRYLKNTVENPSWWFTVSFNNKTQFNTENTNTLCLIIGDKIKDEMLIDMIRKLIVSEVVRLDLGGCYLGKGLPQECGLNSILINIYLNPFDQKLQELRLQINKKPPKSNEDDDSNLVFHKPLKIYAVRYLDEILVITSGSKGLTNKLKYQVVQFLDQDLGLEINRGKTIIHSAVSEEITFLGMDLRAVTPSVLHPPMSEKAIRAKKKYLRQKEVRLQELKNRRETNRKKLAMKIFTHVHKKLKTSNASKSDFQIENEVREIFDTWARETVHEFLNSIEERAPVYRNLASGDFLSLKRIRDQLPVDLVNSYDDFQEKVNKYLNPIKARENLLDIKRKKEEEEERKYTERTVKDLTELSIKVDAPEKLIKQHVKSSGFTNAMGRPRPIALLTVLEDTDIIKWYAGVAKRWLEYFCCCRNFKFVKTIVSYHLRFSCLLTLAEKHESSKREAIKHYTKDLRVFGVDGSEAFYFPTEREVKMMGDRNLADVRPVDGVLGMALVRLACDEGLYRCGAHFCERVDTVVYRVRLLDQDLVDGKWMGGFDRKCVALCPDHVSEMYVGALTLQDVDYSSLLHIS
ncbi:hypothetical protein LXL04_000324 [Taraxacum kok-saghyz]